MKWETRIKDNDAERTINGFLLWYISSNNHRLYLSAFNYSKDHFNMDFIRYFYFKRLEFQNCMQMLFVIESGFLL